MNKNEFEDGAGPDIKAFNDLGLPEVILRAITEMGYETPTPIQSQAIPVMLSGQDLLGMAQTGTGKTGAFAIPVLSQIDTNSNQTQVIVLAPTRELAIQVSEAFESYGKFMRGLNVLAIYGGSDYNPQIRKLKMGPQVVVGTPGRILDHLERGTLKLDAIKTVILDEADEMLRMGFIADVEKILDSTPGKKQMALFSATMPAQIKRITTNYLKNPAEIRIASKTTTVENIEQCCVIVNGFEKMDALYKVLEAEKYEAAIIFARTKQITTEIAEKLEARGHSAACLNGDMNQSLRERTIDRLKAGQLDIVVATDVAARGLDVERIGLVINYDAPFDSESYVHRIGRTGRAGRTGKAILFVAPRERFVLGIIERATRQRISNMELPTRDDVQNRRMENFKEGVMSVFSGQDVSFFQKTVAQLTKEMSLSTEDLAAALLFLAQKDKPLELPAEEVRKPRGDRPAYNNDRPRGDRPSYNNDRPRGDRPSYNDRPRGDRPAFEERSGEKRPYEKRPYEGKSRGFGGGGGGGRPFKSFGSKPGFKKDKPAPIAW